MSDVNIRMIEECPDDGVIFDIGANRGRYTVLMAQGTNRHVYAFEPEPENLRVLRQEIVKNNLRNVEVHGLALSDHEGIEELMLVPNTGGHSIHKVLDGMRWKHRLSNSIKVAVITLDKWCEHNDIGRVDGIKLDVEAHEVEVLRGAKETLKKYHPLIALETHQTVDLEELKTILEECGYQVPELKHDAGYFLND